MIWRYLVLNLFLYLYLAEGEVIGYLRGLIADDGLSAFLQRKCNKNAHTDTLAKLEDASNNKLCIGSKSPIRSEEDLYNALCSEPNRNMGYDCTKVLVELVDPCLDDEEKYLPSRIVRIYNISLTEQCTGSFKEYKDRMERLKASISKCAPSSLSINNSPCLVKVQSQLRSQQNLTVTEAYLCNALEEVAKCTVDSLRDSCSDDVFPNYVSEAWQPYLDTCSENTIKLTLVS